MVEIDYGKCQVSRKIEQMMRTHYGNEFTDAFLQCVEIPKDTLPPQECSRRMSGFMKETTIPNENA